jgi:hypothetical protein
MNKNQLKMLVCFPIDPVQQEYMIKKLATLTKLGEMQWTFIHIFQEETYPYLFQPMIFPSAEQKIEIKKEIENRLNSLAKNAGLNLTNSECLFSFDVKFGIIEYLKKNPFDFIVSLSRGKHGIPGLFSSSFTDHLIKFSPSTVISLR